MRRTLYWLSQQDCIVRLFFIIIFYFIWINYANLCTQKKKKKSYFHYKSLIKASRLLIFGTCGSTVVYIVGALWCSGSCSRLVIRGSWVRIPLGAYALRQGILSTIVSLDPGVVNGYSAGIYSLKCLWAPIGSSAKAGVIMLVMM